MSIESELREAIAFRNEMAVELAGALLQLTLEKGDSPSSIAENGIVGGKYAEFVTAIEALTAAILLRSGMSWNAMAARVDQSRQALHRRLSARGEEMFYRAQEGSGYREYDPEVLAKALRKAEKVRGGLRRDEAMRALLPYTARDLILTMMRNPSIEEILNAPPALAAELVELRKIPQWWDWGYDV